MIDTGAGVIDADYRGVVYVLLFNLSDNDFQGTCQSPLLTYNSMVVLQWRKATELRNSSLNESILQTFSK